MRCFVHFVCTDDDNRVKLKSLSGREDCQHDYINASYVDVSVHYNYTIECIHKKYKCIAR